MEAAGIDASTEPARCSEPRGSHPPNGAAPAPSGRSSTRPRLVPAGGPSVADAELGLITAKPAARIVQMTPARAAAIIEGCNTHNRSCEDRRVGQYAEDMRRGGWLFTGEAVKISRDGVLLDGQHRLFAVLDANVTIVMLVITGLDPRAQEVMDQGIPRRLHDALHLRGEPDPNNLAAALRVVAHFYRDGVPFQMGRAAGMSHGYALKLFDQGANRADLLAALRFVRNHRRGKWTSLSQLAALHFLFSAADQKRAEAFMAGLLEGGSEVPAVCALRETLLGEWKRSQEEDVPRAHIKTRTVYTVMAWNAGMGEAPEFRWRTGDGFPGIRGLTDDLAMTAVG